jgi:hypothetical protein
MKTTQSTYNPLEQILELFPKDHNNFLTHDKMQQVKNLLDLGGVHCDNLTEIMQCLVLLNSQKILQIEEWSKRVSSGKEISYIVKRNI